MRPITRFLALALSASLLFGAAPAGAAEIIRSVSFADANTGYMSGVSSSPSGSKGFVSVTKNGGDLWVAQWLPGFNDIVSVAAGDGQNALAVASFKRTPWRTSDWGSVWAPTSAGPSGSDMNLAAIERFSGGRLVAVGKYEGAEADGSRGAFGLIATSNDHGASWSKPFRGPLYPPTGAGDPPSTNADMRDVDTFGAGTHGWAVGNERDPGTGGDSATFKQILIFKTTNGGADWTQQYSTVDLNGLSMTSVVAVSDQVAYMAGTSGVVLKTINGGAAWTSMVVPGGPGLNAIDAVNANTVVAVGEQGRVAVTTNGGANWTTRPVPGAERLRSVSVVTPATWFVVGDGNAVYKTTDAGATWVASASAPQPPPGTPTPVATTFTGMTGNRSGITYGTTTSISSTLKTGAGAASGVQQVSLQRWNSLTRVWTTIASRDTYSSGYVNFNIPASSSGYNNQNTYFRLTFGGAAGLKGATSAARYVDPKAYLGKPYTSTTSPTAKKTYTWRAILKPRHAAGTKPVKLRFERKVNGTYRFYKNVYATAYNSSTYSRVKASYKLPYKGKWRVRAYHDDAGHYPTYSSWLYVTAK